MTHYKSDRENGHDGRTELDDPTVAATDGGVVLEDETADPWNGPFDEYDKYGEPTGSSYVRCRDCGIEVVTSIDADTVGHRDDCRFEEGGR